MAEGTRDARSFVLEGITIVASILLALVADAAWGFSRDRAEERAILVQLAEEFSAAEAELARDIEVRERILARTERWRASREDDVRTAPIDSVSEDVTLFLRARFYTPSHPVLDDILSSGRFQLLRSGRLRSAILKYQQERARIRRGEEEEGEYASGVVLPFLSSRVDLDALYSSDTARVSRVSRQILEMLPDPEFGSLLWGKQAASLQAEIFSEALMNSIREVQAALVGTDTV